MCKVVLDLKNSNALITVGILNTYSKLLNRGYCALLQPFVLNLLPKSKDDEIFIENIQKGMQDFGFSDFPKNVVKSVLKSLGKEQNGKYVRIENNHYYVNKVYDDNEFINNRNRISNCIRYVLDEYVKYSENKYGHKISIEKSQNDLINFLNDYGFITVSNIYELFKINRNDKSNFRIAQFILEHSGENDKIYKELIEIVKGFLFIKVFIIFLMVLI